VSRSRNCSTQPNANDWKQAIVRPSYSVGSSRPATGFSRRSYQRTRPAHIVYRSVMLGAQGRLGSTKSGFHMAKCYHGGASLAASRPARSRRKTQQSARSFQVR
jgi:hypothetical protein